MKLMLTAFEKAMVAQLPVQPAPLNLSHEKAAEYARPAANWISCSRVTVSYTHLTLPTIYSV